MEIKGYCMLKSTNTVTGYVGDMKDLLPPHALRIIDIAVDGNGFLVIEPCAMRGALCRTQSINNQLTIH